MFDRNGDGFINTYELRYILLSLGQKPTDSELEDVLQEVDLDENGTVEFSEFLNLMERRLKENDWEERVREAFGVFDQNGDGFISTSELHNLMENLGMMMTKEEAKEMIRNAGIDNDGRINYDEFLAIFRSRQ